MDVLRAAGGFRVSLAGAQEKIALKRIFVRRSVDPAANNMRAKADPA